ncbi:unnamed protein product [Anisakis simplex]|uniref:G_PROTEIN_RECEP_F1_2 domain-containing protein n=1 Tax=Anisakis simplex TaxID=6269 RepID=A0A0M3KC23_ANISI|nr:unnamed protein product [Anisakis simplex]
MEEADENSSEIESILGDNGLCGQSEECGLIRFTYIMIGSVVAICGCFFNLILIVAFKRAYRSSRSQPVLYPIVLAILDAFICFFYIILFGADAAAICLRIEVKSST